MGWRVLRGTDEIIVYNPITATWSYHSQFPTVIGCAGSAILDGKAYVVGGRTSIPPIRIILAKVFAADITPPMDLYYRENSSAGSVTLGKLSSDIIGKLNQSKSVSLTAGMVTSVDYNNNASNEYTILERTDRNASHQWEEMAPLNEIRNACDGVEALDGKIYFVGGRNFDTLQSHNKFERFDPVTNTWETLDPLSVARGGSACAVLDGKLYVIGGQNLTSVEIYDPVQSIRGHGVSLPNEVNHGTAITVDKEIYLISGRNSSDSNINKVFCFDSTLNKWSEKANAPTTRHGAKLVWYENRIWAIGGVNDTYLDVVESYDPFTDTWRSENSLSTPRHWAVAWVENNKIYVGGGSDGSERKSSVEAYDSTTGEWSIAGELPAALYAADLAIIGKGIYVMGDAYSKKVYAADLLPSRDLYFRSHDSLIPNNPPVNLNSNGPLVVSENQPIGTVVDSFAAMDPEGGPLSFVTYPSPPVDLNPELWLDASSFQNLDLLAGKVRTWTDLSAGSKQANQFEVSRMPTFDKAERGIFFDGVDDFLDVPGFNPSGAMSVYIVFSNLRSEQDLLEMNSTDPLISTMLSGHQNPGFSLSSFNSWNSSYRKPFIGGTQSFPKDPRTNGLEFSGVLDYGKTYLFSSELTPSQGIGPLRIGSYLNGLHFGRNRINEIIILSGHSSENLRNQVEKYLLGKWEIENQINQSLFALEPNGTLRTATVLDFETSPQIPIRVEVRDEYNASMVKDFVVQVVDDVSDNSKAGQGGDSVSSPGQDDPSEPVDDPEKIGENKDPVTKIVGLRPVPLTKRAEKLSQNSFQLNGQVLFDGGSPILEVGFVLGTSIRLNHADRIIAKSEGANFYLLIERLEPGKTHYFRAYARNSAGETLGSLKKFKVPSLIDPNAWYGKMEALGNGWWRSEWIGAFSVHTNGWIYHTDLGWAYAVGDKQEGVWLWTRKRGWLWTAERAWPYLWQYNGASWLYLLRGIGQKGLFYDFTTGRYAE